VPDTLVAVDEGMVLDEREPEGCGLPCEIRIEVFAPKRLARLCDGRFQGSEVAKEGLLATLFHHQPVEEQYLSEAEVPHHLRRSYGSRFSSTTAGASLTKASSG
jgi:hypothetical protein